MYLSRLVWWIFQAFFVAGIFIFGVTSADAADGTFFLYPETGVYNIGDTFEVEVRVNTGGETVNTAEGRIEFNNSELGIVSITTNDSIFNSWLPAPSFSNEDGVIYFGGSTTNGYEGSDGNILTIEFEALANTESQVNFQSGAAIIAANGLGTNILTTMASGVYTMTSKEVVPVIEYVAAKNTPSPSVVSSPDFINEDDWYATSTSYFTWELPDGVTAVRILIDEYEDTIPTLYQPSPITQSDVLDLDDGIWFFHVQAQNSNGWGSVENRRFNIDTEKPELFTITEEVRVDTTNPGVSFFVTATDTVSGIAQYEFQLDDGEIKKWKDDGSHIYTVPSVSPGNHTLLAKVLDEAGNYLLESVIFTVDSLVPPALIDVPTTLTTGTVLVLKGISQPDTKVTLWIQENESAPTTTHVESDADGAFAFVYENEVTDGIYTVWAQATDERGATSILSEKISIAVQAPGIIVLGQKAVNAMSVFVPLAGLSLLLLVIIFYGISRVRRYRSSINKEAKEAEVVLHKTFDALREQVRDELRILDRAHEERELTNEEQQIRNRFKDMFDIAEETVGKEIRDIKKVPPPTRIRVPVQSID